MMDVTEILKLTYFYYDLNCFNRQTRGRILLSTIQYHIILNNMCIAIGRYTCVKYMHCIIIKQVFYVYLH